MNNAETIERRLQLTETKSKKYRLKHKHIKSYITPDFLRIDSEGYLKRILLQSIFETSEIKEMEESGLNLNNFELIEVEE